MVAKLRSAPADDPIFRRGAIRSRIVSRLSGASMRQLQRWHQTGLIQATVISGSRGTPHLFSWIDYMKVRAAVKLLRRERLPNRRLRRHIEWLDANVEDWFQMPLVGYEGRVLYELWDGVSEVTLGYEAAPGEQIVAVDLLRSALSEVVDEGALGAFAGYADAVSMHPAIKGGSPVIAGTRLETRHLAELVERGQEPEQIATVHRLSLNKVRRAIEFETIAVAS